jgi:signal transduction histidine kinase
VVAAVALGSPEARQRVAERLLTGLLPVDPEELPYLATALGVGDDGRVEALVTRLGQVPGTAGLPYVPDFKRSWTAGGSVEGVARDGEGVLLYEVRPIWLLRRAGLLDQASVGGAASVAGGTVRVPGVTGLTLTLNPRIPGRLRVRGLRVLLWLAVLAAVVGLAAFLRGLQRESRAVEREKAFLTGVTHELRTPLTAIRLFGERLAKGRGDAREYGAMVAEESQRLESLVERVLALSRGEETLSFESLDPGELVRSAASLAAARAERRRTVIAAEASELPEVRWDGEAVRQALLNLLDNAIQHGREGGRVEVRAIADGDLVKLAVSDDGPGIGKEDRKRIFGRFERGTTAASGTGLGLFLVDRVARAHGGQVDLVTEEGRGSTFTLALPRLPLQARPQSRESGTTP